MPHPAKVVITLTPDQRSALDPVARTGDRPAAMATRARILPKADAGGPDPSRPGVCADGGGKQLVGEVREPLPVRAGSPAKEDCEYERHGTADLLLAFEPLGGRRLVAVTGWRTAVDFARLLKRLLDESYPDAERVVVVTGNPNTHCFGPLYEAFAPGEARRLAERLEWHLTPKHGSWLDMAEVELGVPARPRKFVVIAAFMGFVR